MTILDLPRWMFERTQALISKAPVDRDGKTRLQHFTVFVVLGLPIMVAFAVYHIVLVDYETVAFIVVPAVGLAGGWWLIVKTNCGSIVYRVNIVLFGALILYALILGQPSGSQIFWMYTYPLIAFFLLGKTEGLFWNFLMLVFLIFFLTTSSGRQVGYAYPPGFVLRFFVSYLTVLAIAFWFEYMRDRYRVGMEAEHSALVKERQRLFELVAERKRAEKNLQESEERFRTLSEAALEGLVITEDGHLVDANTAFLEMFGYGFDEIKGRDALEFVVSEDREYVMGMLRSGRQELYEHRALRKDGSVMDVAVRGRNTMYRGRPARVTAIRDMTERKRAEDERLQMEQQILHSQKLESLGVLAGGIAHDFNNLLMGVLGNAELAALDLPPEAPALESIEKVTLAARRAADLAGQMLAYSGRGRFVIESIDLSLVVEELVQLADASVTKGTSMTYQLAVDLSAIRADRTQVGQVAMNLITNASEALDDENGVVIVSTGVKECGRADLDRMQLGADCVEGEYAFIQVSDTGVGMNAETIATMFDPFFSTKFVGRGLGLAAVLGIVRGHNGAITVVSEPGDGTTVTVFFPTTDVPAEPSRPVERQTDGPPDGKAILVVDDEETVLEVVHMLLEKAGFRAITARDGCEGLEEFEKHVDEIDCVLLDLTMPKMDGVAMFEKLRRVNKSVPVILASGYDMEDVELRFSSKGFAGFIQKPYTLNELRAKLSEVLA